ncbi:YaiI/YqxD family protein [Clostridium sp. FAM 1755]|uniref:YaiI/YqxD family protein n=1 Tax=Clostridium TaxID=1485 RepID=UPI0013D5FE99|nr:YaiI/YqxD family protein [Clostridium sporogenes]EJP6472236.1 YaiI/YqxD family protein [Clostridium botulinum]NFV13581.1 YaiI/YqxD family protein [Clostridium sporogenes]
MRILVDADACPGRDIIEQVAKKYNLDVIMFCDINHVLNSSYSIIRYVDHGFQSVDMVLINEVKENDIIITQDFGVAAMALGKKAKAINPKGYIFSNNNIDRMLFERHISSKMRRAGIKNTSNHKKRNSEDNARLKKNLTKLIIE